MVVAHVVCGAVHTMCVDLFDIEWVWPLYCVGVVIILCGCGHHIVWVWSSYCVGVVIILCGCGRHLQCTFGRSLC